MDGATIMTEDLSKGVPYEQRWRFIEAWEPELVAKWKEACEAYESNEAAWQERTRQYQISGNMPRRDLESPYGKARREAKAAVEAECRKLLVCGRIVFVGHRDGDTGSDIEPIPGHLEGKWGPGYRTFTARGVTWHDVRLFSAETFKGPGRPSGKYRKPKDARERLGRWVREHDAEDKIDRQIADEIAAAHPEVLKPAGWWERSVLEKYVNQDRPLKQRRD